MKVFHCDHCGQLLLFENTNCLQCGRVVAYAPLLGVMISLDPISDTEWTSPHPEAAGWTYRLCANYRKQAVCNWVVRGDDPNAFCRSCRLTRTIPNLRSAANHAGWAKLEQAKRRLIYTLHHLGLPLVSKRDDPINGLLFDFLADPEESTLPRVMTGHDEGIITLSLAEADDAERERRRMVMHEPYRTVLGHFRHEIGHYYWDRLIDNSRHIDAFRDTFGDERDDYDAALRRHYQRGAPENWQENYISAYATTHPWEDWAETWAHYMHIVDALETAAVCGITLRPKHPGEPTLADVPNPVLDHSVTFAEMMQSWLPLTYVLNNLNRGLGIGDAYPFVLSPPVINKMRFVHQTICATSNPADLPLNVTGVAERP